MKRLLYLIAFIPSLCFAAAPFFQGTAANALHANIADKLTAGTTGSIIGNTFNLGGGWVVKVCSGTCTTGNNATTGVGYFAHGSNSRYKVFVISVRVHAADSVAYPPEYTQAGGFQYNYQIDDTNIYIKNESAVNLLSKQAEVIYLRTQ